MAFDKALVARVRKSLGKRQGLSERKMFGGVAFLLHGNMCCGVTNDDLVVRVGPDGREPALTQPHARPMDFTGRPMKAFVYVGPDGTKTDDDLRAWIARGLAFAESLPKK